MSYQQLLNSNNLRSGGRWIAAVAIAAVGAAVAWKLGFMQEGCLAAIGILVVFRGILPFLPIARFLDADAAGAAQEVDLLRDIDVEHSQELLDEIGEDASSVLRMFEAELRNVHRMARGAAAHGYVNSLVTKLRNSAAVLELTGELCPLAGLGGSLLGLGTALPGLSALIQSSESAGAEARIADVFASFATVASTTLAGCVGAAVCLGLYSILDGAIKKHETDLRRIADSFARGDFDRKSPEADGDPGDDDLYNLL